MLCLYKLDINVYGKILDRNVLREKIFIKLTFYSKLYSVVGGII